MESIIAANYLVHRLIESNGAVDVSEPSSSALAMTRREFLHNVLAGTPLVTVGISTKGIYGAQIDMVVQRYSLAMLDLPPSLRNF